MSGRIVHLEPDPHQAVQALLPWYLNGTLEAAEQARVQQHLAGCADCSAELAFERQLREAVALAGPAGDAQQGFAQLRQRIRPPTLAQRLAARWHALQAGWQGSAPWLRGLVLAQACAAVLALVLLGAARQGTDGSGASYRALGDPAGTATPNLIVRFRADAPERELRAALRDSGAQLVGGPTASDAYLLAVPPAREAQALQRLHARPSVLLAESLDARGAAR
jgi:anti-sigma factor RsiW